MNNEKLPSGHEPEMSDFKKKWENFWYHYKIHVIIGLVAAITLIVCTTQMITREKHDFIIMYAGPRIVAVQDLKYMEMAVEDIADDFDKNGKVIVTLDDIVMLSPEEREAAANAGAVFDANFIRTSMTEFYQQIAVGEIKIYLLSPYMYSEVKENGIFMPLSEIFDEIPESAYDDCAISLLKTDFGKHYNGINDLPEDTLICIRRLTDVSKVGKAEKEEREHTANVELFKKMVEFDAPQQGGDTDTSAVVQPQTVPLEFSAEFYRADGYGNSELLLPFLENAVDITASKEGIIPIAYFDGTNKLTRFYQEVGEGYQFDVAYDSAISFAKAIEKYDAAFFEENALIILHIEEGSGSIRHTVESVEKTDWMLEVNISRQVPEVGTDDMADWFAVIEVKKADISDVVVFSADIAD